MAAARDERPTTYPDDTESFTVVESFDDPEITWYANSFRRNPHRMIAPGGAASAFGSASAPLPVMFEFDGPRPTERFLAETDTVALLIVRDGDIVVENYRYGATETMAWPVMSVTKSMVSALVGIALDEGLFGSLDEPITAYVSGLLGSAYDGVPIVDILQMSSGVRWDEDYADPASDISRFIDEWPNGLDAFMAATVNERTPGTFNRYASIDTQALGMLLRSVTGMPVSEYLEAKIWTKAGMEFPGYMATDTLGVGLALGGMRATARDLARFGGLYLRGGRVGDRHIVPAAWVADSTRCIGEHVAPGENDLSDDPYGYGYQWWVPEGDRGEYMAIGIYNQYIYVDPPTEMIVVKLSANRHYTDDVSEASVRDKEHLSFFRSMVEQLRSPR